MATTVFRSKKETRFLNYKTNASYTEYALTAWYFGEAFTNECSAEAKRQYRKTGKTSFRFWQEGTGYLTIEIN